MAMRVDQEAPITNNHVSKKILECLGAPGLFVLSEKRAMPEIP
jgi:hypothetical protein